MQRYYCRDYLAAGVSVLFSTSVLYFFYLVTLHSWELCPDIFFTLVFWKLTYFFFLSSSKRLVKSSKSTSSPPPTLCPPTLVLFESPPVGISGKSGILPPPTGAFGAFKNEPPPKNKVNLRRFLRFDANFKNVKNSHVGVFSGYKMGKLARSGLMSITIFHVNLGIAYSTIKSIFPKSNVSFSFYDFIELLISCSRRIWFAHVLFKLLVLQDKLLYRKNLFLFHPLMPVIK